MATLLRSARISAICVAAALLLCGESFKPDDVKILGDLDYGQSSGPVEYSGTPRYAAFIFTAKAGDRIEATVTGSDRNAVVAIADGSLNQLATSATRLEFRIPNHGPDAEAYYIVFRDSEDKPARFTVSLKRVGTGSTQGD
jgi:hypothetical protein